MSGNFVYRRQLTVEWGPLRPRRHRFQQLVFRVFDWNAWSMFAVALGVRPGDFEKVFGIMGLPVVDAKARFLAPAKFNDVLEIVSEGEPGPSRRSAHASLLRARTSR
jgi:4-hydroxybenzoyl-CoA thioesterase